MCLWEPFLQVDVCLRNSSHATQPPLKKYPHLAIPLLFVLQTSIWTNLHWPSYIWSFNWKNGGTFQSAPHLDACAYMCVMRIFFCDTESYTFINLALVRYGMLLTLFIYKKSQIAGFCADGGVTLTDQCFVNTSKSTIKPVRLINYTQSDFHLFCTVFIVYV